MRKIIGAILFLFSLPFLVPIIYLPTAFEINCGARMERAANANSIALAQQEMESVVSYLESNKLTTGYTSILYEDPKSDLGFFYKNMKDSLEELRKAKNNTTPLESSNVLIKLRETLTDQRGAIICPLGISMAPHNGMYALWGFMSFILALVGSYLFLHED